MQTRNSRNVANSRHRRKDLLVYLMGGKCSRCGYDKCIKALEFHHIDKKTKSFTIATSIHSLDEDIAEIKKCSLLCANCHREVEDSGELTFNTFDETRYEEYLAEKQKEQEKLDAQKVCPICGKPKTPKAYSCQECASKHRYGIEEKPSREELKQMIRTMTFTDIGRKYGINDNSVRRWCDKYNLPRRRKDIEAISDSDWESI